MKRFGKAALSALMFAGATAFFAAPASAEVNVGISFGFGGPGYVTFSDPCAYYDYYDEPPPWGLPPDYCDYPVYFEPVYYDDYWYRGPIYYRWYGGERLFWLNGGWRHDEWRGARPEIRWEDRGGWGRGSNGNRGGYDRNRSYNSGGAGGGHNWSGGGGYDRNRSYNSGGGQWSGGGHNWQDAGHSNWSGGGHDNWSGGSGGHGWSGGGGGHSWSGIGGGGHSWSGGGGGGHGWSGGRGDGGHGRGDGGHRH
ncbi:MAG: hypothetical protein ABSD21_04530 [Rhizomicrobium sp.]|jgi:hypothetical protein